MNVKRDVGTWAPSATSLREPVRGGDLCDLCSFRGDPGHLMRPL